MAVDKIIPPVDPGIPNIVVFVCVCVCRIVVITFGLLWKERRSACLDFTYRNLIK